MKKYLPLILSSVILFDVSVAKTVKLKEPPKELEKYYPPNSDKYEFLTNMYNLSTAFTGVFANIQDGNWEKAKEWAKKTEEYYLNIGKLVSKWDKILRKDAVKQMVKAVENKDVSAFKRFANTVGKSCVQCHKNYQLSVKIIYHYPSYEGTTVEDPVTGVEYGVDDYMKKMTNDMKLLKVYLLQGDKEKAVKYGNNFVKRVEGLQQMCSDCHTNNISEKVYFGEAFKKKLTTLKEALDKKDEKNIFSSLKWIGANNCFKCHNVHQTPYMIKEKF